MHIKEFMQVISRFIQRVTSKQSLYAQLLFTAIAFLAMIVLSYFLIYKIVHNHLSQNAESVLNSTQARIESEMQEPKVTLSSFSRAIRLSIYGGYDVDGLRYFINDISDYIMNLSEYHQEFSSFRGVFFCYDSLPDSPFINTMGWIPPDGYDPTESLWYKNTKDAGGEIAETLSYSDDVSEDTVLIYSRCIHDDDDNHMAVVGLRMQMNAFNKIVNDAASLHGSYGVLLSDELIILAHPNPDFLDKNLRELEASVSALADKLEKGKEISEEPLTSFNGEPAVAFFRTLPNGWHLGLITPKSTYFESVTMMMFILSALGLALAAALILILIRIDNARKKADSQSRHKSIFLANMSHEIRTPMNAIIGMTTIGKSSADTERKDYCFSKIQDASNHLLGVINDILDMSKIEANKFEMSPEEFNFEKMLQRVVNVVNFRIEERKQKLTVRIDPVIPKTVVADDQRLAQVIANLLGNAIKFTPEEGSIILDARFLGEEDGVCTLQISVSDTGIGVSAEQQARLFDSFEQAESSTTRKYGGTGLGLAISKGIVELMGGRIWIDSEPGMGSTFAFTIQVRHKERENQDGLLSHSINWSNVRIMVVDDDPGILEYFREITKGFGVLCDTAISGEEALALVKQNGAYHIYFVDWKMPGMDGIQLASELKMHVSVNSVVIMISAAEWASIVYEAKEAGVDKFLSKPLFPSAISEVINECLGTNSRHIEDTHTNIAGLFAGRQVLIAEDVEINREIIQSLLEPTQIKIDFAENGAEVVRMFRETPDRYDLILMDVQMPEMDGYEATRRIRALDFPNAKTIRIIALTANVFREDIEKCLEAGMDNHLGKPLDFDEVMDKLRLYLPHGQG